MGHESSPKDDSKAKEDLSTRRALLAFGGGFGVLIAIAFYSNTRHLLEANEHQWIDAVFGLIVLAGIYVLIFLSKPSWLALGLVTAALAVAASYTVVIIKLYPNPSDMRRHPWGIGVVVVIATGLLGYAARRWDR